MRVERPVEVDADDLVPERLVGHQKRQRTVPTGIVDERPDRTELRLDFGDGALDGGVVADVDFIRLHDGVAGKLLGLLAGFWIEVENRDLASFSREPEAQGATDALSAASHDRNFVFQSAHAVFSL